MNYPEKIIMAIAILMILGGFNVARSAFNQQINYQGKLTDTNGISVANGSYNLKFRLCIASDCTDVSDPVWTETLCYSPDSGSTCNGTGSDQRVSLTNGLFSALLGNISSLSSVNFNQTLYLEAQVGGSGTTPSWETLTPRKKLGAVPAAFEAKQLGGKTWAAPDAIGSGTPAGGAFTTLSSIGLTAIGNSSATAAIDSSDWDINTLGAMTGISGITSDSTYTQTAGNFAMSGTGTFGTGTGAISLNGDVTIAANKSLAMTSGTGTFAQTYSGTGNAHSITSSSTTDLNKALNISQSGATIGTDYGLYAANTGAGTTNVGGYFSASGATNNYGLIVENGNVGIGTATPSAPLHVVKNQDANTKILVQNTTSGTGASANLEVNNGSLLNEIGIFSASTTAYGIIAASDAYLYSNAAGLNLMADNANGVIKFATGGNAEKMRIDSSGNVGIGTTAPGTEINTWNAGTIVQSIKSPTTQGSVLEMYSSAADASGNYTGQVDFGATAQSAGNKRTAVIASQTVGSTATNRGGNLEFYTKANGGALGLNMIIDNVGNLGIGDTNPSNKRLSVSASGAQTAAYYGTYIANTATSSTASINKYGAYISSTGTWNGASANNYGLYVDTPTGGTNNYAAVFAGGNVGIGTATPTNPLHVVKNQNATTTGLVENTTAGTAASANLRVSNDTGLINQIGIYSASTTAYGAIAASDAYLYSNAAGLNLMADNANGVIKFATGGNAEKMRIDSSGNVGIGDTNPSAKKLSVSASGAQTAAYYGTYIANTATSSTASINKYGAYITSTGTWNGASANNYGLYVDTPTGGTNNYAAVFAGGNVGIGAAPSQKLDVSGTGLVYGRVVSTTTGSINEGGLYLQRGDQANGYAQVIYNTGATLQWAAGLRAADAKYHIFDVVGNTDRITIDTSGNVGIGTAGPESRVQISGGGLCVGSDANCNTDNNTEGIVYSSATAMTLYDVAENYPTKDATLVPAEVVTLDNSQNGPFVKRGDAGEAIVGVVSTAPSVLLGGFNGQEYKEEKQVAVALSGRVPVKVSLENGPIKAGDYLTSSSTSGVAMKATKAGRVIGIALENSSIENSQFENCKTENSLEIENCKLKVDKVMVFVNPHWYGGVLAKNGTLANPNGDQIIASLGQSQSFKDLVMNTVKESLASLSGTVRAAGEWTFEKITSKKICAEDVCIDRDQLKELLDNNRGTGAGSGVEPAENQTPILTQAPLPPSGIEEESSMPSENPEITPSVSPAPAPSETEPLPSVIPPETVEDAPTPSPEPSLSLESDMNSEPSSESESMLESTPEPTAAFGSND